MQSAAIPISPSISPPFNKPRLISNLLRISPPSSRRLTSAVNSHSSSLNLSASSSSARTDGLFSLPSLKFSRTKSKYGFAVRATSVPESSDAGEGQKSKNDFAVKATSVPESADSDEGLKSKHDFPVQATSVPESSDAGEGQKSKHDVAVKAMSVPESADAGEVQKSSSMIKTIELGLYFGLWYLFNIYFNIYNKQVLKVYNYPVTVTLSQFAVGSVFVGIMWLFNLYRPKVSAAQLAAILPLAVVHTLGNLFTNMSLGKVAVSFTHTIKAMEPFFSVLLSVVFLGEKPTGWVVLALLPIVGGVALASVTEASFNWAGFWSAMASNLTNQSRNVLSKKVMVNKEESLDNITLFSLITVMSFVLLAPATIFMEGVKFTPAYLEAAGLNVQQVYIRSLLAALCFHAYQQVSYMILQRVSPVTHSVGNCVKRVVVITSSVLFFKTPVSPINALGTGIALAGVFLYSRVKSIKAKPKAA